VGVITGWRAFRNGVATAGSEIGATVTQGGAALAYSANSTASAVHVPIGALSIADLNENHAVNVRWVSAGVSVPEGGNSMRVSTSIGRDHVITAAQFGLCSYGLTVSAAGDPIIRQDGLPGVGTYWVDGGISTNQRSAVCSADSAPTAGWQPADLSTLRQLIASFR
jgi:hypothetical protein